MINKKTILSILLSTLMIISCHHQKQKRYKKVLYKKPNANYTSYSSNSSDVNPYIYYYILYDNGRSVAYQPANNSSYNTSSSSNAWSNSIPKDAKGGTKVGEKELNDEEGIDIEANSSINLDKVDEEQDANQEDANQEQENNSEQTEQSESNESSQSNESSDTSSSSDSSSSFDSSSSDTSSSDSGSSD